MSRRSFGTDKDMEMQLAYEAEREALRIVVSSPRPYAAEHHGGKREKKSTMLRGGGFKHRLMVNSSHTEGRAWCR